MALSRNPFIIATDQNSIRPDDKSRKFIRRHVMKGKNRERVTPRRLPPKSWINRGHNLSAHEQDRLAMRELISLDIGPQISVSPSLIGFATGMEPHMLQLIHNFIKVMQNAMYPFKDCIDFYEDERCWYQDFCHDPAFGQTIWHGAQAFFNTSKSQTMESATIVEINKAIFILRRKLADIDFLITDSTIFTVLTLAMISEVYDDYEAAKQHVHGLYQMIRLRGGIDALSQKQNLQFKCCRLDLRFALQTGSKPLFFADSSLSWEVYLPKPGRRPIATPLSAICEVTDGRLANVWHDLGELATSVNISHQTKRKLSPILFQEALISVQYRLQHLSYEIHDRHELLRTALLVFSTATFLQANLISMYHWKLIKHLEIILRSTNQHHDQQWSKLVLWLIVISQLSGICTPQDYSWMHERMLQTMRSLKLLDWHQVRQTLKCFIWVDSVHDQAGENVFNETSKLDGIQRESRLS